MAEAEAGSDPAHKWATTIAIACTGITLVAGEFLKRRNLYRCPEAAVGVVVGFAAAALARLIDSKTMAQDEKFDHEFFMVWLLPPIIFAAGYNMNIAAFFESLGPTMLFAFLGTLISALVVGGIILAAGSAGLVHQLSPIAAFFFGSLISATDPVTVLAIFKAIGVKSDLFAIIFGESVLNDAVAIVLARTTLSFAVPGADVSFGAIMQALIVFISIFVGSMIIGITAGICSSLSFKALDFRNHPQTLVLEAALAAGFPWMAYYASEALELSGIVAILFCGIVMAAYVKASMSHEAKHFTSEFFETLACVAEAFVFVYLGMAFLTFPILTDRTAWPMCLVALCACFIGRLHVFFLSWCYNVYHKFLASYTTPRAPSGARIENNGSIRRCPQIPATYSFLIWFSGLRGGVAFAIAAASYGDRDFPLLCEEDDSCTGQERSDGLVIIQATLVIAVFTIFVFGSAVKDVAVRAGVIAPDEVSQSVGSGGSNHGSEIELSNVTPRQGSLRGRWSQLNERYIIPRLVVSGIGGRSRTHNARDSSSSRAMLGEAWIGSSVESQRGGPTESEPAVVESETGALGSELTRRIERERAQRSLAPSNNDSPAIENHATTVGESRFRPPPLVHRSHDEINITL